MKYLFRVDEDRSVKLYQFYLDEVQVDFTFYCANQEIVRCHKIVLMAHSDSVQELLKDLNTCNFTKVSFTSKTVKKFMEFLYTGKTFGSKNDISDVQELAKTYGMKYKHDDEEENIEVDDIACEKTAAETPKITCAGTENKKNENNETSRAAQSKEMQNSESVIVIEEDIQIIEINDSTDDHIPMKLNKPELSVITLPRRNNNQLENEKTDSQESFRFSADIEILENGSKMMPVNSHKKKRTPKKGSEQDQDCTLDSQGLVINPFSVLKKKRWGDNGPSTSTQIQDVSNKNGDNEPLPKKTKRNAQH